MSNRTRVQVTKINYQDKIFYNLQAPMNMLFDYQKYVREVGDEAYLLDNELYVDEGAYFNICLFDTESVFIMN